MDARTYFAADAIVKICRAAGEPDVVKKTRRLAEGLAVLPHPARAHMLIDAVNVLAQEELRP